MYIHATGGIGNQLFQYNLAHLASVFLEKKITILFEDSSTHEFLRRNELSDIAKHCNHNISIRTNSKILILVKILDSLRFRTGIVNKSQRETKLIDQLLSSKKTIEHRPPFIVRGASQDWRLVDIGFSLIKDEIEQWLAPIELGDAAESICRKKFQLMHIRRGDYSLNPDSWGLLSLDYYKQSVDKELTTVIVTDDIRIIDHLQLNFPLATIFGPAELDQLQTLKLMSFSSKITVANSSFSWWGARFAHEYSGAESIFPDRWFKKSDAPPNLIGDPVNSYKKAIFE